ncbi:hypothetical protein [Paraburkholderia sp. J63]|uniref:hypothetical protein n=1 Tax=Paraburkholderia sp. J63 TaxID=2805434 RepID=UPI002ABE36F8|nr:hypothetical protein [Paraburkholderia sp. J63]
MKMKKWISAACFGVLASQSAFACIPADIRTAYFGKMERMTSTLQEDIKADIKRNHYVVIEERVGLDFYPLVRKGGAVYLDGKVIALKDDFFRYYGQGYYRVNHELYYMGEPIGVSPRDGTVTVSVEDRTKPQPENWPPNVMWCQISAHADILETSEGLRVEHVVYDN